jgi:protein TonB
MGNSSLFVPKELPIEVRMINEVKLTPPPAIPQPHPKAAVSLKADIIVPDVHVSQAPSIAAVQAVAHEETAVASVAGTESTATTAVVDFSSCNKPEYPANSLLRDERGTVRIMFLITANGNVGESKIARTSGYSALDHAAVNALSLCHFKPSTMNGVAQQSWTEVEYVWKLPS